MKRTALALFACLAAGSSFGQGAFAQEMAADNKAANDKTPAAGADHSAHKGAMGQMNHVAPPACAEGRPECAPTATPAFAKDGRLWLVYSVGNSVYAASSRDNGKTFLAPVVVATAEGGVLDANGEARPKIVALPNGTLLASYTMRPEKSHDGTIFVARSTDGGKSFAKPTPLLDDSGQRFEVFAIAPKGRIYAAWLDKRDAKTAKAAGREFAGSGTAVGWSDDGGATFQGKKILMDHSCECCRIAAAIDRDGLPVFVWRHVFDGNLRDHYAAKLSVDGATLKGGRVSEDEWATNSCPHHGPSLAIDASGGWHVVWYARGKKRQGLFYARSLDGGKTFSEPEKFADDERAASRPYLLAAKGGVYRAWKEFDGATTTIALQASRDGGKSWSAARVTASTQDASDHPLLIERKGAAYLSWLTRKEGYRLVPIAREQAFGPPPKSALAETHVK